MPKQLADSNPVGDKQGGVSMRHIAKKCVAVLMLALSVPGCGVAVRKTAALGVRLGATQQKQEQTVRLAGLEEPTEAPSDATSTTPEREADTPEACPGPAKNSHGMMATFRHTVVNRWHVFKTWFITSYRKTQRWPEPYATLAERAYRDPFDVQANAGRKYSLGLFDHHFIAGSGQLNAVGKRRLLEILRSLPPGTDTLYVQPALSQSETDARVAAVRRFVEHTPLAPEGLDVALLSDMPGPISGPEATRAARNLAESVGTFPRWMDRNTRINGQQQNQQ